MEMILNSTRNNDNKVSPSLAILQGISQEGGLFVPSYFPKIDLDFLKELSELSYIERAKKVLSLYLTDFSDDQLQKCISKAYSPEKFDNGEITQLSHLFEGRYMLELWHGPTCAFKDMALQLLPHLLKTSAKINGCEDEIIILTATSGDTGKAALDGFSDVEGTKIIVFYPAFGVSDMQKRQMITQEGKNVSVCAIDGNFDDAQSAVKTIFTNEELKAELAKNNMRFSSANSINFGRLVPQVVYYISSYCDLVKNGDINTGDEVNICVPTGNFGNILAAYYAKQMGLPVGKFICASNKNNVLTDFINTGVYNKNRDFYATSSPSMDILISSNLERLLYHLYDGDDKAVSELYKSLNETGVFKVSDTVLAKLQNEFYGEFCDDGKVKDVIGDLFEKYSYLCDTHTAVAVGVCNEYKDKTNDARPVIIASTANPYKFTKNVLSAVTDKELPNDEYDQLDMLNKISGVEIPKSLGELKNKEIRFKKQIDKADITDFVKKSLLG